MTPFTRDLILIERHLTAAQVLFEGLDWTARARQVARLAAKARNLRIQEDRAYAADCERARRFEEGLP